MKRLLPFRGPAEEELRDPEWVAEMFEATDQAGIDAALAKAKQGMPERKQRVTASIALELGEAAGHPFRGNQYTDNDMEGERDQLVPLPKGEPGAPDPVDHHRSTFNTGKQDIVDILDGKKEYHRVWVDVATPETMSGFKLHIYTPDANLAAAAVMRVYDDAKEMGLGMKVGSPHFFEQAAGNETQAAKGVVLYLPERDTVGRDVANIVQDLEGWPIEKVIPGDAYVGNGVSYRYELDQDFDYDLGMDEYRRHYATASLSVLDDWYEAFGESAGHPFRGNQWTAGEGKYDIPEGESAFGDLPARYQNSDKILGAMLEGRVNEGDVVGLQDNQKVSYITDEARAAAKAEIVNELGGKIADAAKSNPEVRAEFEKYMDTSPSEGGYYNSNRDAVAGTWGEMHGVPSRYTDSSNAYGSMSDKVEGFPSDERLYGEFKAQEYVDKWAGSAADTSGMSLALQTVTGWENGTSSESFGNYLHEIKIPESYGAAFNGPDKESATMGEFVRAEYEHTQSWLREQGIGPDDPVELYRGMRLQEDIPKGSGYPVDLNPASSWTVSPGVADTFARIEFPDVVEGYIFTASIPAKDIISTALTGRGALIEGEVLIRNTPGLQVYVDRPQ